MKIILPTIVLLLIVRSSSLLANTTLPAIPGWPNMTNTTATIYCQYLNNNPDDTIGYTYGSTTDTSCFNQTDGYTTEAATSINRSDNNYLPGDLHSSNRHSFSYSVKPGHENDVIVFGEKATQKDFNSWVFLGEPNCIPYAENATSLIIDQIAGFCPRGGNASVGL